MPGDLPGTSRGHPEGRHQGSSGQGLWLSLWLIHPRPGLFTGGRGLPVRAGHERWRTVVNAGAQYSKACEGASLPWVQIPPPPPLTCDDANPRACSVATGTAVVSVLGHKWSQLIGPRYPRLAASDPNSGPCSAADVIWEQTRQVSVGAGRSPHRGRRTRQAGCRLPSLRRGRRAYVHAAEACTPAVQGRSRSSGEHAPSRSARPGDRWRS